jgi:hypothetical protein
MLETNQFQKQATNLQRTVFADKCNQCLAEFENFLALSPVYYSLYLTGSFCSDYFIPDVSDLDLTLVTTEKFSETDSDRLNQVVKKLQDKYGIDLDISIVPLSEASNEKYSRAGILYREAIVSVQLAGNCVWGSDVLRSSFSIKIEDYIEATKLTPFEFSRRIRNGEDLHYPLSFPDEKDEFYGYVGRVKNTLPLKPLVSLYSWIGTATVALETNQTVGNKKICIDSLKECDPHKGAELERMFFLCRESWAYKEPQAPYERQLLKSICRQALCWENDYFSLFLSKGCTDQVFKQKRLNGGVNGTDSFDH